MRKMMASESDRNEILALYKMQIGRRFCAWDEHYPGDQEITFDLSRDSLFVMKDELGHIAAAISIDQDEAVNGLPCWNPKLQPGGELSRLAVRPDLQGQGLAGEMMLYGLEQLRLRGMKSVHILVNRYNEAAIRAYARFPYEVVSECDLYDQPFLCYEMDLALLSNM